MPELPSDSPTTGPPIEFWPLERLVPYARNARTHSAEQIEQIAASLRQWGWTQPILADNDGIIAGHGRVLALRQIYASGATVRLAAGGSIPPGCAPVIPCAGGWSEAQRRAYILADNQLALRAGWDSSLLKIEVAALNLADFDLELLGFDSDNLTQLLGGAFEGDEEPSPEQRQPPDTGMALAIVLSPQELKLWRQTKENLGFVSDKAALLALIEKFTEEES